MKIYLTIESKIKPEHEFDKAVKNLFLDDVVFSINNDDKCVHLDFSEFGYLLFEDKIIVKATNFGGNFDELNEECGILPKDINYELLSNSYVDSYVILAELNDDYLSKYDKKDFTEDGLYKGFKLVDIGYISTNKENVLFNIDQNAKNAEGL